MVVAAVGSTKMCGRHLKICSLHTHKVAQRSCESQYEIIVGNQSFST